LGRQVCELRVFIGVGDWIIDWVIGFVGDNVFSRSLGREVKLGIQAILGRGVARIANLVDRMACSFQPLQ
jgi:hypothetical protein